MVLRTRLTEELDLAVPVILAPMGVAASGRLAAAVAHAGGLGLIGVGYRGTEWVESQFEAAGSAEVGAGFITWRLDEDPRPLDLALTRNPRAICLSFGDPRPYADRIAAARVPLICQVQTRAGALLAIEAGARVVVAQGTEAGGHAGARSMSTLVPELADLLAARAPDTLLCAAGGIADGRGLASALLLGADGVLMGSRLWATTEANVHANFHRAALSADGDGTVRTRLMDTVRGYNWPAGYTNRALRNGFLERWWGREDALAASLDVETDRWISAWEEGDAENANVFVSESVGLIRSIEPVANVIGTIVAEAEARLRAAGRMMT